MSNLDRDSKHSTALQLNLLVQRVSRNFDGKRLIDAVFPDLAKGIDTVRLDVLL